MLLRCSEGRTESDDKGVVSHCSIKAFRFFFGFGAPVLKCFDLFAIEYKILDFSRPYLYEMAWFIYNKRVGDVVPGVVVYL